MKPFTEPPRKEVGEIVLHSETQLTGEVTLRANTRIVPQTADGGSPMRETEVASGKDALELLSTLHAAGIPAQVVRGGEDGPVSMRIGVRRMSLASPGRLVVDGDLTLARDTVCGLNLQVRGNLTLEPDAVLLGDASVDGNAILGDRSVISGGLGVWGNAILGKHAHVGSLQATGNVDLGDGAAVVGEITVDSAMGRGEAPDSEELPENTVEEVAAPER